MGRWIRGSSGPFFGIVRVGRSKVGRWCPVFEERGARTLRRQGYG